MLIAILFFLEAVALIIAAIVGYVEPDLQSSAIDFVSRSAPFIREFDLVHFDLMLAPLLAVIDVLMALGIWFLQKWARAFIVVDIGYRLCDSAVAALYLWGSDRDKLRAITSTPHFVIGVLIDVIILGYFLDPDARRSFGMGDEE